MVQHRSGTRRSSAIEQSDWGEGVRDYALAIGRERYADFGRAWQPRSLLSAMVCGVSRETLRRWMADAGIWLSRQAAADVSSSHDCDARPMANWPCLCAGFMADFNRRFARRRAIRRTCAGRFAAHENLDGAMCRKEVRTLSQSLTLAL